MSKPAESRQAKSFKPDAILDIRGEVCPFTFIETKLKLEEMNSGEILEVILDHEPAVNDVPRSVESEGHEVLAIKEINQKTWKILIKKK